MAKTIFRNSISLALVVLATACNTTERSIEPAAPVTQAPKTAPQLSAAPLESVTDRDIVFAQTALKKLGYKPGVIDGMWGAQSASAMQAFEQQNSIESANGQLSALNLATLSKTAKVLRKDIEIQTKNRPQTKPNGLVSKLDAAESSSAAPQLIILDAPYPVLAKANPYSELVTTLQAGTGVYVLGQQGEWFEIESEEQDRGFIKDNP